MIKGTKKNDDLQCLTHDTTLAEKHLVVLLHKNSIPAGLQKGRLATVPDFRKEPLTGKGISHNTNSIFVQLQDETIDDRSASITCSGLKEKDKKPKKGFDKIHSSYSNVHDQLLGIDKLTEKEKVAIDEDMRDYREVHQGKTVSPKMHILETHEVMSQT